MTRRPILLFDVMGTLVSEPFFDAVPSFFGMTLEELLRVKDPRSWIDFEYGRIDEETHAERFFSDGRAFDVEGLKTAMRAHYEWLDGMEPLVGRLRAAGYELHTLSNYSPWYQLIEDKLEVSRHVAWTFVSCNMGLRKPDAAAYRHAAAELGVSPGDCLFIDDRVSNVEGAEAVGMGGLLRVDTPQLVRDLVARGIVEAAP